MSDLQYYNFDLASYDGNLNYPQFDHNSLDDVMSCINNDMKFLSNRKKCTYKPSIELYYYYNNNIIGEHSIDYTRHAKENYKVVWKDFNLGKINPSEFEKIKFIGESSSFETITSWAKWGPYWGKKANQVFGGQKIDNVINNVKSNDNFNIDDTFNLQSLDIPDFLAKLRVEQNLGLTWYKKKEIIIYNY